MNKQTAIDILAALGVDTGPRKTKPGGGGKYLYTLCPLHDDSDPSFSITLSSAGGSWRCFGCGAQGSSLGKLIQEIEQVRGPQIQARELWDRDIEPWLAARGREKAQRDEEPSRKVDEVEAELAKLERESQQRRDSRLRFEYEVMPESEYSIYQTFPRYFREQRGLTDETCEWWDLRDDPQMQRALVPIRDFEGHLVGAQGRTYAINCACGMPLDRWADDPRAKKSKRGKVKYCPSCGRMRPVKYLTTKGFDKSLFLFGEHMLDRDRREAIIVESPLSVLWLWQHGYPNAVATMGAIPAPHQFKKMRAWFHRIFLFADGDPKLSPTRPPAGIQWATAIHEAVGRYIMVKGKVAPLHKDPGDLPADMLEKALGPPPGVRKDLKTHAKDAPGVQSRIQFF